MILFNEKEQNIRGFRSMGVALLAGSSHVHRVGGLVHPSYVCGRLAPTKIPLKSPGLNWAPLTIRGTSLPSIPSTARAGFGPKISTPGIGPNFRMEKMT